MTITFAQMGFAPTVTATSATPAVDGYFGEFQGMPYGIHPAATPEAYAALVIAISADAVTVVPYVATPSPTLAEVQAQQTSALSAACAAAIVAGFTSSALGVPYTYPSKETDQANLSASVISALLAQGASVAWAADTNYGSGAIVSAGGQLYECVAGGPSSAQAPEWPTTAGQIASDGGAQWQLWTTLFWCESSIGMWSFIPHTSQQIQKVGVDAKTAILACMAKNVALAAQVAAAESVAAAQAVVW